jgi:hypothetical protein
VDAPLTALQPEQQDPFQKLAIHVDNARLCTPKVLDEYFEGHRPQRADHLPHSPDLAPSDFFLFGLINGKLKGTHFPDG